MDRIKILPPQKDKRKAEDKRRTPDERISLMSRLVAWRHDVHATDTLAAVYPPSFIIDDTSIALLAKLCPQDITNYQQIRVILDHSIEWENEWSKKIFEIIQRFDQDLTALRQTTATQKKTSKSE